MKFRISFEKDINSMLKKNIGLCPYFKKNNHYFFDKYFDSLIDYRFHPRLIHRFISRNSLAYLRYLLKDESSFENPLFFILFKAFVYAEIKFIVNYIPQNSHEERLTGHLISGIENSLAIVSDSFMQKAFQLYNSKVELNFHYADLSSNNRERITGADFGLIFHINLPDYPEKVNVAIIQSKKFNRHATIELNQLKDLSHFADEAAYYCFYDMNSQDCTSPLIQKANIISSIIEEDEESGMTKSLKREIITERYNSGIPLSLFLIFEMLNPSNDSIKSFSNIWDAKRFIDNRNKEFQLSRVLTVSVGGVLNANQDLRDISDLFSFNKYKD
ncbi:hypothetical protein JXM83_06790 [Candidatus Woesearchaeota archaeon]|nr:hypothetical protein [Candidatus Woesearchaeota archaeon]